MDVAMAIRERRSIRSYEPSPVEEEKILQVLEAGRLAPSASNRQEWKFIVVRDAETRQKLVEACFGQKMVAAAPAVLVVCGTEAHKVMSCGQPTHTVNAAIALTMMILQAQELGLGTCWMGHFDAGRVAELLGVPEGVRVVAISPLGYPAKAAPVQPRLELSAVASFERY